MIGASTEPSLPGASLAAEPREPAWLRRLDALLLAVLLALAAVAFNGYRFGDSNHGITVPIVKRAMDPSLYPNDPVVATSERYSTIFYVLVARLLPGTDAIPAAFFVGYLLSTALLFGAAFRIGCWVGGPRAGILTAVASVPIRIALAGATLYRPLFGHSHLGSAVSLWCLAWFLRGGRTWPMLVLSLFAYNHLLYSAYLLVPLALIVVSEWREAGTPRTLRRLAAAVLPLVPLGVSLLQQSTPLTREWLELLRLRSEHHSFPSAFVSQMPPAAFLLALAVLPASALPRRMQRLLAVFTGGILLQFAAGVAFSEWWPVKAVLQYQPFRAWVFLQVLLHALVARGVVAGLAMGGAARIASVVSALVTWIPGLEPLLGVAVVLALFVGWPRPTLWARATASLIVLTSAPFAETPPQWAFLADLPNSLSHPGVLQASVLLALVLFLRGVGGRLHAFGTVCVALVAVAWLGPALYSRHSSGWERGGWRDVQNWVRANTPRDAVILSPVERAGFRVFSERTIVGEWKDGTQQYFDDGFAIAWKERMDSLDRTSADLTDAQLLEAADRYRATYIVLPWPPARSGLDLVYRNRGWAVYRARPPRVPAEGDGPQGGQPW